MKSLVFTFALVGVVAAGPGCKKAKDMAAYKDKASALAAKFGPKLADLSKDLPDLAAKAKDLPVNVPGVDKLGKLIAENKSSIASAQELLASLPAKLGTSADPDKDLADAEKELAKDVDTAEADEKEEKAIETAAAAAAAPAPAGSGSGSAK